MFQLNKKNNPNKAKIIPLHQEEQKDKTDRPVSISEYYYQFMKELDDLMSASIEHKKEE
jgi:hypothetical protein